MKDYKLKDDKSYHIIGIFYIIKVNWQKIEQLLMREWNQCQWFN